MNNTQGLHHITAIVADPQRTVDFYEGVLGQRFIKRTVNFDDPNAYHLYFGDYVGTPGTALTFFSWQGMIPGIPGSGEANAIYYRIPYGSTAFWQKWLTEHDCVWEERTVFSEPAIKLLDPDNHAIYLIEADESLPNPPLQYWQDSPVPALSQLQGLYGVRLGIQKVEMIEPVLEVLGYKKVIENGLLVRYSVESTHGQHVDIEMLPDTLPAQQGVGSIHHIAFRAKDDVEREQIRTSLIEIGLEPTGLVDRTFFNATYVWTPAGVLFEISTDAPGFTVNEPAEELGERLVLPPHYEHARAAIEARLPLITLPRHSYGI